MTNKNLRSICAAPAAHAPAASEASHLIVQARLRKPHAARLHPGRQMKTLSQIEPRTPISSLPFTISQSGSYYLSTNLTGVSGLHGIYIATGNVTLDLTGFTIQVYGFSVVGIYVAGSYTEHHQPQRQYLRLGRPLAWMRIRDPAPRNVLLEVEPCPATEIMELRGRGREPCAGLSVLYG